MGFSYSEGVQNLPRQCEFGFLILVLNLLSRPLLEEAHLLRLYFGSTQVLGSLSKVLDCQWDRAEDRPVRVGGAELDSHEGVLAPLDNLAGLAGLGRLAPLAGLAGPLLEQP